MLGAVGDEVEADLEAAAHGVVGAELEGLVWQAGDAAARANEDFAFVVGEAVVWAKDVEVLAEGGFEARVGGVPVEAA